MDMQDIAAPCNGEGTATAGRPVHGRYQLQDKAEIHTGGVLPSSLHAPSSCCQQLPAGAAHKEEIMPSGVQVTPDQRHTGTLLLYTQPEMLLAAAQGSQLVMAARCESRSTSARVGRITANDLSGW